VQREELGNRLAPGGQRLRLPELIAASLCAVAVLAGVWVSTEVFDRLPHVEDEFAYLFQARTLAAGSLLATAPAHPEFFEMPFIMVRDATGRLFIIGE
jgi:hypothetical protein